jgi:hypothetical protein
MFANRPLQSVQWFVFFLVIDLFTLRGHNFLIFNLFLTIFDVLNELREEF